MAEMTYGAVAEERANDLTFNSDEVYLAMPHRRAAYVARSRVLGAVRPAAELAIR